MPHRSRRMLGRGLVGAALVAAALVAGGLVTPDRATRTVEAAGGVCSGDDCGAGGEFHAMDPVRVLDTRDPGEGIRVTDRHTRGDTANAFEIQVTGVGDVPAFIDGDLDGFDDNVLAVAVTVTVVSPSRPGYLRAFGAGAAETDTALVNFAPSDVVPNSAVLRPGANGELTIRLVTASGLGRAHVVVDMFGWISTTAYGERGARLLPPASGPGRIFDSRLAEFGGRPLGAARQVQIPIWGADSVAPSVADIVPNDPNVSGVLVNISGVNYQPGSAATYLSARPTRVPAGTKPATATGNFANGQVRSILAFVPVGPDGSIWLYNRFGDIHVTVDLMGYMIEGRPEATRRGRIVPLVAPFRAFDTRAPEFFAQPLPPANAEDWSFEAFVNDVRIGGDPVGPQLALIGNIAGADLARIFSWAPVSSYLTAYPTGATRPTTANLVIGDGEVVPNMVMLGYGGTPAEPYQVRVYNRDGFLDYVLDVSAVVLDDLAP